MIAAHLTSLTPARGAAVLALYAAHGLAGIVLERRAERYRVVPRGAGGQWDMAQFDVRGRAAATWYRRWYRSRIPVWLGAVLILSIPA